MLIFRQIAPPWRWLNLILGVLLLSSCALFAPQRFPLLLTNSDYSRVVAQQQWLLDYRGQTQRLQAMVELTETQLTLVLLDSFGQRIATLRQDAQGLDIQRLKSHLIDPLLPQLHQVLQFTYWPLADLQQRGEPHWAFSEAEGVRQVSFSGILADQIHYQDDRSWQGIARYTNNKSDFQLVIESSQLQGIRR